MHGKWNRTSDIVDWNDRKEELPEWKIKKNKSQNQRYSKKSS